MVIELRHQDANGKRLPLAQRASVKARAVIKFGGGFGYAVARLLWYGADARRIVEHERDGGRRQVKIFSERPQADGLPGSRPWSWFGALRHAQLLYHPGTGLHR